MKLKSLPVIAACLVAIVPEAYAQTAPNVVGGGASGTASSAKGTMTTKKTKSMSGKKMSGGRMSAPAAASGTATGGGAEGTTSGAR